MNRKTSNALAWGRGLLLMSLAGAILMTPGSIGFAESHRSASKGLVGTWSVLVTLRNCSTNAAIGSFQSLVTFHEGGTLSESTSSPSFAIGQRSPGHGNWDFERHHTYRQRMVSLINFDTAANLPGTPGFDPSQPVTPGFFAGWATVTHRLTLSDADHALSSGTNDFYKADGTPYRTGCSTAVATRFE